MTGDAGVIKRTYNMIALFVLLNVVGAAGLVGYLVSTGALSASRMRTIGMVLGGADLVPAVDDADGAPAGGDASAGKSATGGAKLAANVDNADPRAQMGIEILERESERIQVELDQRLKLINSIMLRVENERKELKKEREVAKQADEEDAEERADVGFEKQVAILASLSPKIAVQHILGMNSLDEAAKILIAIDTDKAKKIVEAARRGDDLTKMQAILQRLRTVAPSRSADLEKKKP